MNAEIITIGDELLIGQVIDTNSTWIAGKLNDIGIDILRRTSVPDSAAEITDAIDYSFRKRNLVIVTGGLGPTKDDITKKVLCDYFGTRLVYHQETFDNIIKVLSGRVPMNELNKSQALVPESAVIIANKAGTAPILWFEKGDKVLISMPGVPEEMKLAMEDDIIPRLREKYVGDTILHKKFVVKGYPESVLAEKLESWENGLPGIIKLAYLPQAGYMKLRLTGRGKDQAAIATAIESESAKLKEILDGSLYEEPGQPLENIVGKMLEENHLTLSTAESCTGGRIAAAITSVPGSSVYFKGSIVAYHNQVKTSLLGVSSETLEKYGAVSEETVIEMVKGAVNSLKTDCAIATSGIAGPGGGTPGKPVGTIWIAVACGKEIVAYKQEINRGRTLNIKRAVDTSLLMLLELLEKTNKAGGIVKA